MKRNVNKKKGINKIIKKYMTQELSNKEHGNTLKCLGIEKKFTVFLLQKEAIRKDSIKLTQLYFRENRKDILNKEYDYIYNLPPKNNYDAYRKSFSLKYNYSYLTTAIYKKKYKCAKELINKIDFSSDLKLMLKIRMVVKSIYKTNDNILFKSFIYAKTEKYILTDIKWIIRTTVDNNNMEYLNILYKRYKDLFERQRQDNSYICINFYDTAFISACEKSNSYMAERIMLNNNLSNDCLVKGIRTTIKSRSMRMDFIKLANLTI